MNPRLQPGSPALGPQAPARSPAEKPHPLFEKDHSQEGFLMVVMALVLFFPMLSSFSSCHPYTSKPALLFAFSHVSMASWGEQGGGQGPLILGQASHRGPLAAS